MVLLSNSQQGCKILFIIFINSYLIHQIFVNLIEPYKSVSQMQSCLSLSCLHKVCLVFSFQQLESKINCNTDLSQVRQFISHTVRFMLLSLYTNALVHQNTVFQTMFNELYETYDFMRFFEASLKVGFEKNLILFIFAFAVSIFPSHVCFLFSYFCPILISFKV